MSKSPADLTLERVQRLGREMTALHETIASLTRMLALQLGDMNTRLDRIEQLVRGTAGEQLTLANQILSAQQEASRAHQRLDAGETE